MAKIPENTISFLENFRWKLQLEKRSKGVNHIESKTYATHFDQLKRAYVARELIYWVWLISQVAHYAHVRACRPQSRLRPHFTH